MKDPYSLIKGRCAAIRGKDNAIFDSRDDAKTFARLVTQPKHGGRGKAYRCTFGDHYHITRSYRGTGGKTGKL